MRLRKLTAAALAVLAVTGLSACKSKAGAAAVVDGHRISDSEVAKYVSSAGPDAVLIKQAAAQGQTLPPVKPTVASFLVQQEFFTRALEKSGGVPDEGTLAGLHDRAVATLLQAQTGGAEFDAAVATEVTREGFTAGFAKVIVRAAELKWAVIERVKAGKPSDLAAAVARLSISVSVSARYGAWNVNELALGSPEASLPSFLKLTGATPAANQASTG